MIKQINCFYVFNTFNVTEFNVLSKKDIIFLSKYNSVLIFSNKTN